MPKIVDFNRIWIFSTEFRKSRQYKFYEHPSSGSCADTCGQTDGHDEANRRFSVFMHIRI
jgi:hypothetical protein